MATAKDMAEALYQGKALRQQQLAEREKAIARAVRNVLDKTCDSGEDAARGQQVPVNTVRVAVRKKRAELAGKGAP